VYEIQGRPEEVILINKDRITAGDGDKAHDLEGKAAISTQTNAKVFELLNMIGMLWIHPHTILLFLYFFNTHF
jgi:phosphoribosylaminoimidazole carboxylase/phosphoribosylaminoimidazole-succinocarboxamide synthase